MRHVAVELCVGMLGTQQQRTAVIAGWDLQDGGAYGQLRKLPAANSCSSCLGWEALNCEAAVDPRLRDLHRCADADLYLHGRFAGPRPDRQTTLPPVEPLS